MLKINLIKMGGRKYMRKIIVCFLVLLLTATSVVVVGNNGKNKENIEIKSPSNPQPTTSFGDLPSQFSWLNYGGNWMTPVQESNGCGCGWAISALDAFEAAINIASGYSDLDIDLSTQYILSCLSAAGSCSGGWMSDAIIYIKSTGPGPTGNGINGCTIESCMPFQADDTVPCSEKCDDWDYHSDPPEPDDKLWQIEDYGFSSFSEDSPSDWNTMKTWIFTYGPIVVDIYASTSFIDYWNTHHSSNDVYQIDDDGNSNHGVVICGWVDDPDILNDGYWILKNNWGTSWGYGGYANIAYGCNSLGTRDVTWVKAEDWPDGGWVPPYLMHVFANFDYKTDEDTKYPHPSEEIDFTDTSEGVVIKWDWNFGDGTNSDKQRPTHTYENEGKYEVNLKVWSAWGLNNTRTRSVEVKEIWPPKAVISPESYADNELTVYFEGRYSHDRDGGIITNYNWDFDDGTTSDEQYLYHTFPEVDKIYNVKLTVTDDDAATETATCEVKIDQTVPPVTEAIIFGQEQDRQWYKSTVRVYFEANDWTGVIDTFYRIDYGSWIKYKPKEQLRIPISSEGIHSLEYYSIDYYHNREDVKSKEMGVDKTNPTLDVTITGIDLVDDMYVPPVKINLFGNDTLSGIDYYKYILDNLDWQKCDDELTITEGGIHSIILKAVDKAGNAIEQTYLINIDYCPSPPEIKTEGNKLPGKQITFIFQSHDQNAGDQIQYYIDWGDGNIEDWIGPYSNNEKVKINHTYKNGSYTITAKAKDTHGAESEESTLDIKIAKSKNKNQISYDLIWIILKNNPLIKLLISIFYMCI